MDALRMSYDFHDGKVAVRTEPRPLLLCGDRVFDDPLKPYEPPAQWTAAHVMVRLVHAFETLFRLRVRIGPAGYGSGWPQYVYTGADLNAQEESADEDAKHRNKYATTDVHLPPSAHDVTLMDEALAWPVRFLGHRRHNRVLIVGWAMRRARGGSDNASRMVAVEAEARKISRGLIQERSLVR